MYKRLGIACVALAIVVAACSSTPNSGQPINGGPAPSGPMTLGVSQTSAILTPSGGISGSVAYSGGGSGIVAAALTTTPPTGTIALSSVLRSTSARSVQSSANTPIAYVTFSSVSGATLSGFPGISVKVPAAPVGTVLEAQWNETQWVTFGANTPAVVQASGSATTISFLPTTSPVVTIAPGGSLVIAIYQGAVISTPTPVPTATPSAAPTNMLQDAGFESGTVGPIGNAITATGWTQCTVTTPTGGGISYTGGIRGAGVNTAATAPPVSSFTPVPGTTPAAIEAAAGAPAPAGTGAPHPTITTVQVHSGANAAVFGEVFSNFNAEDYAYDGLCQLVTIPANGASLTGFVLETGNESSGFVEDIIGAVDPTGKTLLGIQYMENIETSTVASDTGYRAIGPIDFSPFAGQTIAVFVGQWDHAGNSTGATSFSSFWFVDDLVMLHP
jgi:hypothetical protein